MALPALAAEAEARAIRIFACGEIGFGPVSVAGATGSILATRFFDLVDAVFGVVRARALLLVAEDFLLWAEVAEGRIVDEDLLFFLFLPELDLAIE